MKDTQRLVRALKAVRWLLRHGPEVAAQGGYDEREAERHNKEIERIEKKLRNAEQKLDEMVQDFGRAQSKVAELGIGTFPTASHTAESLVHQIQVLQGRLKAIEDGDRSRESINSRLIGN